MFHLLLLNLFNFYNLNFWQYPDFKLKQRIFDDFYSMKTRAKKYKFKPISWLDILNFTALVLTKNLICRIQRDFISFKNNRKILSTLNDVNIFSLKVFQPLHWYFFYLIYLMNICLLSICSRIKNYQNGKQGKTSVGQNFFPRLVKKKHVLV